MRLHFLLFLLSDHSAFVAFVYANKCFVDRDELKAAVDQYVEGDCGNLLSQCNVTLIYGRPIGTWCVAQVTDMSYLFVNKVTDMGYMFAVSSFTPTLAIGMFRALPT